MRKTLLFTLGEHQVKTHQARCVTPLKSAAAVRKHSDVLVGWFLPLALALLSSLFPSHSIGQEAGESTFLTKTRQLTLEGARAGEGYFSRDGRWMVFQSERDRENPFYQIYLLDRESGDIERVSPGYGKTTCAWVHPGGDRVLFASTQFDPEAISKQKAELEFRSSGQTRRYSWDYDETFDLVEWNRATGTYKKLTDVKGYDAEGSYSPDGQFIAFSSNRRAYEKQLTEREQAIFDKDPSAALDIYVMKSDGSEVHRITDVFGYDGGPFFSPDSKRICWRRFSEDGATAEVFTANLDGSDVQRLTSLGAMSWAPFYHPSGEYLIFTTNLNGFANFELYIVDAAGKHSPVRITTTDGFDGLPAFTPDGKQLAWTSNRTSDKKSQIFIADWNHEAARKALDLGDNTNGTKQVALSREQIAEAREYATRAANSNDADYQAQDIARHIDFLCRPELGGRLTGTQGEKLATAYVASYMASIGLEPAGSRSDYFHEFPFPADVELLPSNEMKSADKTWKLNEDWRPIIFSKSTSIEPTEIVFAGYGVVAPKEGEFKEYDSYVHLDVENKWVLVFRDVPSDISAEQRQHLGRYGSLRYKAMVARDRGAKGLIVFNGPNSTYRQKMVALEKEEGRLSGTSIAAITVTNEVAEEWFRTSEDKLIDIQKELDRGELMMGFTLPNVQVSATIGIQQIKGTGRNALGVLRAGDQPTKSLVIVGAHIDHLGVGAKGSSLARPEERNGMHRGADDNASGVAAMLEIAQSMAMQKRQGKLQLEHDILFAAWSGEELGLYGSEYFAENFFALYPHMTNPGDGKLYPSVIAAFNLDMVGRLRENLALQGVGSSPVWPGEIEKRNSIVGMPVTLQNDSYLPTDAKTFFVYGVPILSAFTGSHSEYHTPRDVPELINYEGAAQTAKLMGLIARGIANNKVPPTYQEQKAPESQGRAVMMTYLGTVPDYIRENIQGVLLSSVTPGAPADKAGVKAKDIIIELAGKKIENIHDYTFTFGALKPGQETEIVVQRGDEKLRLKITPLARE